MVVESATVKCPKNVILISPLAVSFDIRPKFFAVTAYQTPENASEWWGSWDKELQDDALTSAQSHTTKPIKEAICDRGSS